MKNTEFQKIIIDIEQKTEKCKKALKDHCDDNKDFYNISVKSLNEMISQSRQIQAEMDKFTQTDMYHIIGMANLNAAQSAQFMKATKNFLKYRSVVKAYACMQPVSIINMEKNSSYTLSSGIKLVSKKER